MITVKRAEVTQKTLNKYLQKPFQWGERDCLKMARTQLVAMGHKVPKIPRYSSEGTAIRRLLETGHKSLEDLMSEYCVEIAPATMLTGDLATVKGEGRLSAIVVCVGNKFIGYPAEEDICCVVDLMPDRAWRV